MTGQVTGLFNTHIRLCVLMFLQFFVWGAWYTMIAVYMQSHGMGTLTHWAYTVNPIAAIFSPLLLGVIADRVFEAQRILGVMHILAGAIMLCVPLTVGNPIAFLTLLLLYNLFYMPTLALANTVSFHHIPVPERQFPRIRVFGTVGWIVAGILVSFGLPVFSANAMPEQTALPLYMAGGAGLVLGCFSLTLPRTPPGASSSPSTIRGALGIDTLRHLAGRNVYTFLVSIFLICIPLAAYYNFTQLYLQAAGFRKIAAVQTLGQVSEVVFMASMPIAYVLLGSKRMLLAGMAAWALRYALFAIGAAGGMSWIILVGILLHGLCYDFLFVAGQIYMEQRAPPAYRGQAQGLFISLTYGLGMLVGAQLMGAIHNIIADGATELALPQYRVLWAFPALLSVAVMVFFAFTFKPTSNEALSGRARQTTVSS